MDGALSDPTKTPTPGWTRLVVAGAGAVGIALMAQAATVSSATYDEVAYLRVASDWWRRGDTSEITRMGSPLTFFKLQAGPAFFLLDRIGLGGLIDRPIVDQASLLPIVRLASLWIWLVAFALTASWSGRLYGPRAMAFAACLFALSPNLLAHGSIATMEMPLIAATAAVFSLFLRFLETGRARLFAASAIVAGLAFSCKFTTVVYPPILGLLWGVDLWMTRERRIGRMARVAIPGMVGFVALMLAADWVVTGFSLIRPSPRTGSHPSAPGWGWLLEIPMPQDWVGFATQIRHQRNGGPSYLLGERRMTGWWYYYPVALAVKVPLGCWLLILARAVSCRVRRVDIFRAPASTEDVRTADPPGTPRSRVGDWALPLAIAAFLLIAMFGSKRNYGVRYLLPMAPLAIVWISALAERRGAWRRVVGAGLVGQAVALGTIHPHELSYFNVLAGGKLGGRGVLADSNLDWGQGLRSLGRIQGRFQPLTLLYFGDTEPLHYGIEASTSLFTANDGGRPCPLNTRLDRFFGPKDQERTDESSSLMKQRYDSGPLYYMRHEDYFYEDTRFETAFLAVSASLQHGPWGSESFFRRLDRMTPAAYTDDGTIAIYDIRGTDLCSYVNSRRTPGHPFYSPFEGESNSSDSPKTGP